MICPNDDLGKNCGECLCKYNPIVVIATHQRMHITTKNIKQLKAQSVVPKIVIVCSDRNEFDQYKELNVSVILEPNKPLGRKWQCGVNIAVNMGANPLIVLGSDDILHPEYIKDALGKLNEGFDFIGTTSWLTYDMANNELFHNSYKGMNADFPIGSGKVYSKEILAKIRNKVFDTSIDRKLDDHGFKMIKNNGANIFLIREPKILAIKGNWIQMNTAQAYRKSPNITTAKHDIKALKQYGYV